MPQESPPITRYILIGLAFVLVFVGIAYIAYWLSTRDTDVVVTPTPTPVVTNGSGQVANGISPVPPTAPVLPAPIAPPVAPIQPYGYSPYLTPSPTPKRIEKIDGVIVAQDGRGNLLFNNLTHDENFQLKRAQIEADEQIRLAQIRQEMAAAEQQLRSKTLSEQAQADTTRRLAELKNQLALREMDQITDLARLRSQLRLAELEQASRPRAADPRDLALIEAQRQVELQRLRSQQQYQTQYLQAQTQLTSQQLQTNAQLTEAARGREFALTESTRQREFALNQMSLEQKRYYAQLAYQQAVQTNNQKFQLAARQLETNIARAIQAERHQQTLELMSLQARINQDFLILSRDFGFHPGQAYQPLGGYGYGYQPYGTGNVGLGNFFNTFGGGSPYGYR